MKMLTFQHDDIIIYDVSRAFPIDLSWAINGQDFMKIRPLITEIHAFSIYFLAFFDKMAEI